MLGAVVGSKAAGKLTSEDGPFIAEGGPSAVGAYPHLQRVGDLIFVSGMGPRQPETNEIPGVIKIYSFNCLSKWHQDCCFQLIRKGYFSFNQNIKHRVH